MAGLEGTLIIIGFLLSLGIGVSETCTSLECQKCNLTSQCLNQNCIADSGSSNNKSTSSFSVTLNAMPTTVQKGKSATAVCVHNLPRMNLSIRWIINENPEEANHNETLQIENIEKKTVLICNISSICGTFYGTVTINVKEGNELVILLICVGAAIAILLIFALVMKLVQRGGQVQRDVRNRQREQNIQNIHSSSTTVSSYW